MSGCSCDHPLSIARPHDPPASCAADIRGVTCALLPTHPGACLQEGVARIFDRACDSTPQRSRSVPQSSARPCMLWQPAPAHDATLSLESGRMHGCTQQARDRGASARSPAERMRIMSSLRASASGISSGVAPRLDLRLRVTSVQQVVTIPEYHALGAALSLRINGRYCWPREASPHRLGLAPTVTCASSEEGPS